MVNQSICALRWKLSHMLKSENITVSGSLLLQTKLNNDFPKEKKAERQTHLWLQRARWSVSCDQMGCLHSSIILSNRHTLPWFSTWLLEFFKNARHLRHVIQNRSRESAKYNLSHILTRMPWMSGMTRPRWFFRCPQFDPRCWPFSFCLTEENDLSTLAAWSDRGLNTMRYELEPHWEHGQSRENPGSATKLIPHRRKENVINSR